MEKSTAGRLTAAAVVRAGSIGFALPLLVACAGDPFAAPSGDASTGIDVVSQDAPADQNGADAEAGAGFCASNPGHTFCEDFDPPSNVPGNFMPDTSNSPALTGAKISADMTAYVSPPQSALESTPALLRAGDTANATLGATISSNTAGKQLRLQVDLIVGSGCVANADGVIFGAMTIGSYGLVLGAAPSASELVEVDSATPIVALTIDAGTGDAGHVDAGIDAGVKESPHLFASLTAGRWFRLVLTIDLSARTATLTIGGTSMLSNTPLTLVPIATTSSVALVLGAAIKNTAALSGGCHVNVDNVLFDILP